MKVLHVGPKNYPPAHGGVEKSVYDIIRLMDNVEHFIFLEWAQAESALVKVLPDGIFRQIMSIKDFVKKNNISVIHFNKETFIPHSLYFAIFKKTKSVHSIRGCAWRIERWAWYYRLAFYMLDILACIFIPKVVFVGKEDYRHFSKIVFWRKLFHIPNGVETNDFECSDDASKCVFVGRISPEKNVLRLIEMFSSGDKKLTIYGPFDKHDRSYEVKVMAVIGSNPNVSYAGVLAHTEILPTLAKYNTFYNISFSEGMPVSVLEAASVGLNLVLSDIPQHSDLKFPDAVYVNPHAPHIQTKFNGKSMNNKNHVENNYSIQQTVNQYRKLYEQLNNE
jgi:glycosyltransferase involved in cell wall biosynthesis